MVKRTILDPTAPASRQQLFFINRLGGDVREPLTRQQGSDFIEQLLAKRGDKSVRECTTTPYKTIMAMAAQAADRAGTQWLAPRSESETLVAPVLDTLATVSIQIIDKQTGFARWCKAKQGQNDTVVVSHQYRKRRELGLLEAAEGAALKILTAQGLVGLRLSSRFD